MPRPSNIRAEYKGVVMYITIGAYLKRLEALELDKPKGQRKTVPTMRDMAYKTGIHETTVARIVNGEIQQLDLEKAGAIMKVIREYGFPIEVSDFLAYREA